MANAWDDFWGNLGNNADKLARTHPLVAGAMDTVGNLNKGLGKLEYDAPNEQNPRGMLQLRGGTFFNQQPKQQAVNTEKLPGMTQNNAAMNPFNGGATRQGMDDAKDPVQGPMAKLMERRAQLEAMLDEDYTGDPEMDSLINEAYSSALASVGKARGQANENFEKSDANIAALSAGHVNTIKTDDLNAVKRIGGELQQGYQNTYDTAKGTLEADRSAELQERTAMLQRLGIQEAGLGSAGQGESEAINRMTERQAGAVQQAQGYQAADEVRNNELASSQASAGVERRSALNKDLQGILGKLDESEASINSERSMSQLQSKQSGQKDYLNRMGMISDSIGQIDDRIDAKTNDDRDYALELQKLAQKGQGATGGVLSAVENDLRNQGIEPAEYMSAYAQARSVPFNSNVNGNQANFTIQEMKKIAAKKGVKLDDSVALRVVLGVDNYGTDKLGNK